MLAEPLYSQQGEGQRGTRVIGLREISWQVLRMYDVSGNTLNEIEDMYVNSFYCVRVKGDESECFRIVSGAR